MSEFRRRKKATPMKLSWWKYLCILLLLYTCAAGILTPVPGIASGSVLEETIRNLYFHVPMWFSMIMVLFVSVVYSIKYISKQRPEDDLKAAECARTGILLGLLGAATGSLWAKYTWGDFWPNDAKLNGAAIGVMMYLAYGILRSGIDDPVKRGKVSAIYNIFAYPIFIVLVFILPRINASLHPGNGGNPGFNQYDLDNTMRMVFYPAVIGWSLLAWWLTTLNFRIGLLQFKKNKKHEQNIQTPVSLIDRV